ncbi:MAG: hypothetical protein D6805_09110 [Planctomycetota bacterium]|nr:MAG: hypothetical protein D6805_09110 [Planctomycetota bacterium]
MKRPYFIILLCCVILPCSSLFGHKSKKAKQAKFNSVFRSDKYSFEMAIPQMFYFDFYEEKHLGGLLAWNGKEKKDGILIAGIAYNKANCTKEELYKIALKISEVPEVNWSFEKSGKKENGFAWWEIWSAEGKTHSLLGLLAKHAKKNIYYIFFVYASNTTWIKKEAMLTKWMESCRADLKTHYTISKHKFALPFQGEILMYTAQKNKWFAAIGWENTTQTLYACYAYQGKVSKEEIYQFGIQESGVGEKYWEEVDKGENDNGLAWWEVHAAVGKKESLIALVGKNAHHNIYYLFFIKTTNQNYQKYGKQYAKWLENLKFLK